MVLRAVLVSVLTLVSVAASSVETEQAWTVSEYPNPVTNPAACGREGINKSWYDIKYIL